MALSWIELDWIVWYVSVRINFWAILRSRVKLRMWPNRGKKEIEREERVRKKNAWLHFSSSMLPENLADLVRLVQTVALFHHKILTTCKCHSASLPPQKYLSDFNLIKEKKHGKIVYYILSLWVCPFRVQLLFFSIVLLDLLTWFTLTLNYFSQDKE